MGNELLEKWAVATKPWFEDEMRWLGTPFFNPPGEALAAIGYSPQSPPTLKELLDDNLGTGRARERVDALTDSIRARHELVMTHSWAVPTDEALETIAKHSPNGVVEMGAGTGYWAGLLRARGVDVVAYDRAPYENYQARAKWSEVLVGGPINVLRHPERTLLLCWPPYAHAMAAITLRRYKGSTVIYIGENGGATADDDFHGQLETSWEEIEYVSLPQWPGIRDGLYVYRRKEQA